MRLLNFTARSVSSLSRTAAARKQFTLATYPATNQALTSTSPAVFSKRRRFSGSFKVLAVSPEGSFSAKGSSSAEAEEYKDMQKPSKFLQGRWALVTGSSRGIGLAVAEAFSREGAKVIITCEPAQKEDLQKAEESCKKYGAADVHSILADLSDPKEAQRLGEEALKVSGGNIDCLVNNAGVYFPMSLDEGPNKGQGPLDGSPDDWDKQTQINLMTPMRLTRMVLPGMKDRGEGFVVNICSIEALFPYPSAPAYSATKWGLRGWSKALYAALKADKIKVLTINPAQTSTPMTWSRPDAEYLPDKMIQPDEIAEAILMTFKLNPNVFIEEITIETAEKPKEEKK